jgi:hypothetical protein
MDAVLCSLRRLNMSDVTQKLVGLVLASLEPKTFSSGSKGFRAAGKVTAGDARYQAQVQAVLIGSKDDPTIQVEATPVKAAEVLAAFAGDHLKPKTFSTGRTGFFASGKTEIGGQRYQVQAQAVLLGD